MFKSIRTKFLTYNLILVAFIIIIIGAGIFYSIAADYLLTIERDHSIESCKLYGKNIGLLLDKHTALLQSTATNVDSEILKQTGETSILNKLRNSENYEFINAIFITPEGQYIDPDGKTGDISDRKYFPQLKK